MSVVIETTLGDITVDLYLDQRPVTCLNFLKLCKMKYYNYSLFHTIRSDFIAQTGDPTGEGTGGESIWGILEGPQKRFFSGEKMPKIRHTGAGLLSMVCTDEMMVGSQFFFTLAPDLDSLDGVHCVIGEVTEGQEVLTKLNEVICDETKRPYRDVRITHTIVLEDPFNDPPGLRAPSRSPSPNPERLRGGRIAPDEDIDETQGKSMDELHEMIEEKEAKARATILEIVGDLPDADIAPPENVLFVCKLNPVTTDDDLEIIFSRFGKIVSCEVIRDKKTENSLQYAFIEFENKKSCEDAYFKMDNVLIDDRRIHVDFSQSVSKMRYLGKGRGVQYLNDEVIRNPEIKKRDDTSRQSHNDRRKYDKDERDETSRRHNNDRKDEKSSRRYDHRQYDREKNDELRNRQNERRQYEINEDDRSSKLHNHKEREHLSRKHNNDREKDDSSRKKDHDQRQQHRDRNESRDVNKESKNSRSYRENRYDKDRANKNVHKSRSRSRSRNHATQRLPKNGDHSDHRNINLKRYDNSHKLSTQKLEKSSSPKRDRSERSPRRQKESGSHEMMKDGKKGHDEDDKKKLKQNDHRSKDRHENNKKTKHKDSRTPSPVDDKKKEKRTKKKEKSKTSSSKKNNSKRKHKESTSSDSDSETTSSSSDSSSSSDDNKKKSKSRRRKRKYSSSSSSESSSSNSSSSDSSSDSSSSDSEPKKKRIKKNKNKSSKNSKK